MAEQQTLKEILTVPWGRVLEEVQGEEGRAAWEEAMAAHQAYRESWDAKVKASHPDGKCWPPKPGCPLCEHLAKWYYKRAHERNVT